MKFGDEFVLEFGDKFGESPNLGTNMSPNLGTNLGNPQIWGQICPQICPQKAREHICLDKVIELKWNHKGANGKSKPRQNFHHITKHHYGSTFKSRLVSIDLNQRPQSFQACKAHIWISTLTTAWLSVRILENWKPQTIIKKNILWHHAPDMLFNCIYDIAV